MAMYRVGMEVNRSRCLSAAVTILAVKIQRGHTMLTKRAEEERAALHRSSCVISHTTIVGALMGIET